ncbi:MAG: PilZ domain-containing protein [Acidobacteriales bacterium]|nr:PilZ domain-containing protein [Terriglobales bacterium]
MLYSVPITLHQRRSAEAMDMAKGMSLDLSQGGLGAVVVGNLQVGHTVEIEIRLPSSVVHVTAIVRHTSKVRSGFEFQELSAQERAQIAAAISSGQKSN